MAESIAGSMTELIAGSMTGSMPQSRDGSMTASSSGSITGSMTELMTESMAEMMGFPGVCDLGGYSRLDPKIDSALDSLLDPVSYPTFSTPAQCIGWPVVASKACAASAVERRVRSVSAQGFTSLERSPVVLESSHSVSR